MIKNPILTEKGKQLLSKAIANKTAITLSSMALGDGVIGAGAISLAHPIMKQQIENYSYANGQAYVRTTFTNANLETGFFIREIGIYAMDQSEGEILYSYAYANDENVDFFSPGMGKVILKEIIEMATGFSDSTEINLIIDPTNAMVTVDEFNQYKEETDNVITITESNLEDLINKRIEKVMISHNLLTTDPNMVLGADVGPLIAENLSGLQKQIETLNNDLTNQIKTVTGSLISEKTVAGNVLVDNIYGKSVQPTLTGKNLFDKSATRNLGYGVSTSNGTLFADATVDTTDYISVKPSTAYSFSHVKYGVWYDQNKTYISSTSGTSSTSPSNAMYLRYTVLKTNIDAFQIEDGSTPTAYEPYCGGVPSPNPSYPKAISSLGTLNASTSKYEVKLKGSGKNLWRNILDNTVYKQNNDGTVTINPSLTAGGDIIFKETLPRGVYTINIGEFTSSSDFTFSAYVNGAYAPCNNLNISSSNKKKTFTLAEPAEVIYRIYNIVSSETSIKIYPQIEVGSVVTPFEPYKGNEITISLADQLRGIKQASSATVYDYVDSNGDKYISDIVYREGGKYRLKKKLSKVVFDGSVDEGWGYISNTGLNQFDIVITSLKIGSYRAICERLRPIQFSEREGNYNTIYTYGDNRIRLNLPTTIATDVNSFKTWLASNPLTVYYELATPIETELDITNTNDLFSLPSYDGITNLYINDTLNPSLAVEVPQAKLGGYTLKLFCDNAKLFNDKLNKSDIVNNLLTTEPGKALDAMQGKNLYEMITNTATFQTAQGTGRAIILSNVTLINGLSYTFIVSANNDGLSTTINGKPLYKPNTETPPNLIQGKAVTVWYNHNSSGGCFFIKASAEGDVTAEFVLAGKKFSNDIDTGNIGTMPNVGSFSVTPTTSDLTIPKGYHDGNGKVKGDANLVSNNIISDKSIFGVQGGITRRNSDGNGYTNMNSRISEVWATEGRLHFPVLNGAYIDSGYGGKTGPMGYIDDTDFIASNIIKDKNIFGLVGNALQAQMGQITSSSGQLTFYDSAGSAKVHYYVEVTGLSFKPKMIIVKYGDNQEYAMYKDMGAMFTFIKRVQLV